MAFMTFNKDKAVKAEEHQKSMFGLIEPGAYEMFVQKTEYRPSKNGSTPNINVTLVIRSDVEQAFKGRKIFHTFWISLDPAKEETSMNMIMTFMNKIGVEDGMVFGTVQEVAGYMVGNPVVGNVETDSYKGKERSVVGSFEVSDFQGEKVEIQEDKTKGAALEKIKGASANKKTAAKTKIETKETKHTEDPFDREDGEAIDIDDDDLPF